MTPEWGALTTDYVTKAEGMCDKCRLPCQDKDGVCFYYGYSCGADCDIKYDYTHGRAHDAIALLRGLPSELLKEYLPEERRTPTELVAVILDELQQREKEDKPRL